MGLSRRRKLVHDFKNIIFLRKIHPSANPLVKEFSFSGNLNTFFRDTRKSCTAQGQSNSFPFWDRIFAVATTSTIRFFSPIGAKAASMKREQPGHCQRDFKWQRWRLCNKKGIKVPFLIITDWGNAAVGVIMCPQNKYPPSWICFLLHYIHYPISFQKCF